MRLLIDTQLLVWTAPFPDRLPSGALRLIAAPQSHVVFGAVSIWAVAIKFALGRPDFTIDPDELHERLLGAKHEELSITCAHAIHVRDPPAIHKDSFDRLLLAQAIAEDATLVAADDALARYPGPIRRV